MTIRQESAVGPRKQPPGDTAPAAGAPGQRAAGDRPQVADERLRLRVQRLIERNRQLFEQLRASEARAAAAERRLKAIKSSVAWRSTRPFRRFGAAWDQLVAAFAGQAPAISMGGAPPAGPLDRPDAPMALLIDYRWPRPDQDSGSLDALNLVEALLDAGFRVVFLADSESDRVNPYRLALEAAGVLCLGAPRAVGLLPFLQEHGDRVRLCVLSRVYAGGNHLEEVQRYCTEAHIVFNPVDLHFLREERQAQLSGEPRAFEAAAATRARELLMFSEADATIVVSTAERELLERLDPRARVVHLPLARPATAPRARFEERRGIGFVGGFEHTPNLDAVRFFLAEIWPLVREAVPGCEFSIVGMGLDEDFRRGLGPGVRYLGHVPDIAEWLETVRLTVAPLRFGAGAKGKIASSLACGVPCVATAVAVEGMGLEDGRAVLVADTPAGFADHVRLAYTDAALWRRMSEAGLAHAREALSVASFRRGVAGMLEDMGLAPKDG